MTPMVFRPDVTYRRKLFLIVALVAALALAGSIFLGVAIGNDEGGANGATTGLIVAILANVIWIVPAWLFIPYYYRSLCYEIHDDEVIVRVGVITQSVKHVPYRTVTNLEVKQGPFDRLCGIGTVNIQTAGMSGQQGAEESLVGLPNFQEVYEQVAGELRRFRGGMAPTAAEIEPAPSSGQPERELLQAILKELQALRRTLEEQ